MESDTVTVAEIFFFGARTVRVTYHDVVRAVRNVLGGPSDGLIFGFEDGHAPTVVNNTIKIGRSLELVTYEKYIIHRVGWA